MKKFTFSLLGLLLLTVAIFSACQTNSSSKAPVSLTWEQSAPDNAGRCTVTFTVTNTSDATLEKGWSVYYSQLPYTPRVPEDALLKIEDVNGNFFRLYPSDGFTTLAPGASVAVAIPSNLMTRSYQRPEGFYFVADADKKPLPMEVDIKPLQGMEELPGYPDAANIYANNLRLSAAKAATYDVIPAVKKAVPGAGEVKLADKVALAFPEEFAGEAKLLKEKLAAVYGVQVVDEAPVTIKLGKTVAPANAPIPEEYYTVSIKENTIELNGAAAHGVFNATQTLLAMLKGQTAPYTLQAVEIADYPDLGYRAQMMDVTRNFTTLENLKKLIDMLASYKMTVLHLHFNDDEGWRLEIPGLEELTEVGSRRGHTYDEADCLYPGYDGGFDPNAATVGNGYYTRAEFIDLLKYAKARHINILPEIETPGHARAAIVSMKARYNKYKDTDMAKATEYLLTDLNDTSTYSSVQAYDDNVLDVALPSMYHFLEKVVLEVAAMYKEAGAELLAFHLGGDEVAEGAWMGSPACQALMKEKGWTTRRELAEHYITTMSGILAKHGIKTAGWQEVGLGYTPEADKQLMSELYSVNCWTNAGDFDQLYNMANKGYPIVISSVCNFYMDMTYSGHPDEDGGLDWGGNVDEAISYSMLPFNIYRGHHMNGACKLSNVDDVRTDGVKLTVEGRKNIIGVSGQLFSETIRSYARVEYSLFPKLMGLADRGWNAHPAWEALSGAAEKKVFNEMLSLYYDVLAKKEMASWTKGGVNYRIPMPGLQMKDGVLHANIALPGAEIRYTTDGTEPTSASTLYTAPVKVADGAVIKAKAFFLDKESLPIKMK